MAEEAREDEGQPRTAKTPIIAVAGILLLEAVIIIGAMKLLGGNATSVSAVEVPAAAADSEDDKIVETLVLEGKLPNNKSGITYIFATEVYVQVKKRHLPRVKAEIEQFQNEIKADITAIWRTAEPQHFQEPKLESLTRKVYALLYERFGNDKERQEPVVFKVVIVMSTGFRVDS
jgi:hypothetical protein